MKSETYSDTAPLVLELGRRENDRLFHRLSFIVLTTLTLYSVLDFFYLGKPLSSLLVLLGISALATGIHFLNQFGHRNIARFVFIFGCSLWIDFILIEFGNQRAIESLCLPTMLLGFLVFGLESFKLTLIGMAIPFLTWLPVALSLEKMPLNSPAFICSSASLAVFIFVFIQSSNRIRIGLIRSRKRLSETLSKVSATRAQVETLFRVSPDVMCILSLQGGLRRVNPSFLNLLGYTEEEVLTRHPLRLVHPEDIEHTRLSLMRLFESNSPLKFKNRIIKKTREHCVIEWSIQYERLTGEIFAVGRDITTLESTKKKLDHLVSVLNEFAIIAYTDERGLITEVNENFCSISGYSRSELIGKDHRIINSGIHSKEFIKSIWSALNEGKTWTGELQNRRKNGTLYSVKSAITPVIGIEGNTEGFLAIRFDVTDVKEKQLLADRLKQGLEEAQSAARIGSWTLEVESKKISWSKTMLDILGVAMGSIPPTFDDFCSMIHPDDRALWDLDLKHCCQQGRSFEGRVRIVAANRLTWVHAIVYRSKGEDATPTMISGTCQDISELVEKELEILERKQFLETVLDHLPSTISVKDVKKQFAFSLLNKSGETLLGHSAEALIGKTVYDLFLKDQADTYQAMDEEIVASKKVWRFDREDIDTPSGIRTISTIKIPTYDESGGPQLLITLSDDITQKITAQNELERERLKSMQSSKLATLGEIAAGVAHEINNPLAIISGALKILPRIKEDPIKTENKLRTIEDATHRITKIVNGLRKFSRTSTLQEKSIYSLKDIIMDSIEMTEHKSHLFETPVLFETPLDPKIFCNEIEIEQVVINLISNAIDAVKTLEEKWVRITINVVGTKVILRVIDSGGGISPDIARKLFQPFFTTKPVGQGTGLGLSIVKNILDHHSATIGVDTESKNTCFKVCFESF